MRKAFIITFLIVLIFSGFLSYYLTQISNQHLYFTTLLLNDAGHIVTPNKITLSSLLDFKTTLFASYFLTFTAGMIIAFLISFFMSTLFINGDSFFQIIEISIPILISLTFIGTTLYTYEEKDLFPRISDSFLFSNKLGESINNFYYKYSLHATETFKSSKQKQVKPYWIDPEIKNNSNLKKTLFKYGWLAIDKKLDSALIIEKKHVKQLLFKHKNKIILETTVEKFLENPDDYLTLYSSKTDSYKFLRLFYSLGVMPGIPILAFFIIYFLLFFIFLIITDSKNSNIISNTITTLLIVVLLFYLNPEILNPIDYEAAEKMLFSERSATRVQGMRVISNKKFNIEKLSDVIPELLKGGKTERYWLANTLGVSSNKQNIKTLNILVKDESVNVQCAALNALSQIDPTEKPFLLFKKIIKESDNWYIQYHAYKAYQRWIIENKYREAND